MAQAAVAVVSNLKGKVTATNSKCETRVLKEGDVLLEGEVVKTEDGGKAELELGDGSTTPVSENQQVTLDNEVLADSAPDATESAFMADDASINSIIDAINSGNSLDDLLEETAAGLADKNDGGASNGSHSFVDLANAVEVIAPANSIEQSRGPDQAAIAAARAAAEAQAAADAKAAAEAAAAQAAAEAAAAQAAAEAQAAAIRAAATAAEVAAIADAAQTSAAAALASSNTAQAALAIEPVGGANYAAVLAAANDAAAQAATAQAAANAARAAFTVAAAQNASAQAAAAAATAAADAATATNLSNTDIATAHAEALTITVGVITGDNVVNAAEAGSTVAVTGTVGGAVAGDTVTLTVGNKQYTGTVTANGSYSINVPGAVLATNSNIGVSVTNTDARGNTATSSAAQGYAVDTEASATIKVDSVTPDNIVNAAEAGTDIAVTGSVGGDAKAGDTVTLTVGDKTYTGQVAANGTYSINVPGAVLAANSSVAASVTGTDAAGNSATANAAQGYAVDTEASATIKVDSITADNIINAAEAGTDIAVTGSVGGDAKAGDTVTLTVGDKTYTGQVAANGSYSISVPGAVLAANSSISASVTGTDAAGNSATASAAQGYAVDTEATASITVGAITGDDIVNAAEADGDIAVTGTVGGDAKAGDTVTLTVGDKTYTGQVAANGSYSIAVPGAVLAANSSVAVSVTGTDAAGNSATASAAQNYDNAPTVTAQTAQATEGGAVVSISALAGAADADGDALSVIAPAVLPAGVTYDAASNSFVLDSTNAAFNSLAQGQTIQIVINYGISDGITITPNTATFTVTGTNNAPTVTALTAQATEDGSTVSVSALTGVADTDGDTLSVIAPTVLPAGVTYDVATKSFVLDPSNAAYQSLGQDATTNVVVNYNVSDGTTSIPNTVTFTLTGTNDAPVVSNVIAGTFNEDTSFTFSSATILAGASDIDSGSSLSVMGFDVLSSGSGSIIDNQNGTWTFTPTPDFYGTARFKAIVTDQHGGVASAEVTFNVLNTPDGMTKVVTFEGLGNVVPIHQGYEGITWDPYAYTINKTYHTGSGYYYGTTGSQSMFNAWGYSDIDISFNQDVTFKGAYFTSAWSPQSIQIVGYNDGVAVANTGWISINTTTPIWVEANLQNVDAITINNTRDHWVMDNMTIMKDGQAVDHDQTITGSAGNDILDGGHGRDTLNAGDGNDIIFGGAGDDVLYGGKGNDVLTGGEGNDVFAWTLANRGTPGNAAIDTITDFKMSKNGGENDKLDLEDLLLGANDEHGIGNLLAYIHIDKTGGDAVLKISSTGQFGEAGQEYAANKADQTISLTGAASIVETHGNGDINQNATLLNMLKNGNLNVD